MLVVPLPQLQRGAGGNYIVDKQDMGVFEALFIFYLEDSFHVLPALCFGAFGLCGVGNYPV